MTNNGIRVLSRRNLESYMFSDEALTALAEWAGKPEKIRDVLCKKKDILDAKTDGAPDDLKPVCGQIYVECTNILDLAQHGNDAKTFMRDTLAPLIKDGMTIYKEMKKDIFG